MAWASETIRALRFNTAHVLIKHTSLPPFISPYLQRLEARAGQLRRLQLQQHPAQRRPHSQAGPPQAQAPASSLTGPHSLILRYPQAAAAAAAVAVAAPAASAAGDDGGWLAAGAAAAGIMPVAAVEHRLRRAGSGVAAYEVWWAVKGPLLPLRDLSSRAGMEGTDAALGVESSAGGYRVPAAAVVAAPSVSAPAAAAAAAAAAPFLVAGLPGAHVGYVDAHSEQGWHWDELLCWVGGWGSTAAGAALPGELPGLAQLDSCCVGATPGKPCDPSRGGIVQEWCISNLLCSSQRPRVLGACVCLQSAASEECARNAPDSI
eukprot:1156806-Pelagomonas_calceolata.AAC.11